MSKKNIFGQVAKASILTILLATNSGSDLSPDDSKAESDSGDPITMKMTQQKSEVELEQPASLSIPFDPESNKLSETAKKQIKEIAEYFKKKPRETFDVIGCSSPEGGDDANYWLSFARANAVADELEKNGVLIDRIFGIKGQNRDIAPSNGLCPPLEKGKRYKYSDMRRVDIILNPE